MSTQFTNHDVVLEAIRRARSRRTCLPDTDKYVTSHFSRVMNLLRGWITPDQQKCAFEELIKQRIVMIKYTRSKRSQAGKLITKPSTGCIHSYPTGLPSRKIAAFSTSSQGRVLLSPADGANLKTYCLFQGVSMCIINDTLPSELHVGYVDRWSQN